MPRTPRSVSEQSSWRSSDRPDQSASRTHSTRQKDLRFEKSRPPNSASDSWPRKPDPLCSTTKYALRAERFLPHREQPASKFEIFFGSSPDLAGSSFESRAQAPFTPPANHEKLHPLTHWNIQVDWDYTLSLISLSTIIYYRAHALRAERFPHRPRARHASVRRPDSYSYSLLFILIHYCSFLFILIHYCSCLFILIHSYSFLFIIIHS